MGLTGWVMTLVGIWLLASVILALIVGPLLRRHRHQYPLPADEQDPDQPER